MTDKITLPPHHVATPDLDAPELRIELLPRGYDWWYGTSAQLEAEGLIPTDFEWPKGKDKKSWVSGDFEYWLFRFRPDGHKGPLRSWLELDNWSCRRILASQAGSNFAAARLHEKKVVIANVLWSLSDEAEAQFSRFRLTVHDARYQAFRALVIPQTKKRARKTWAEAPRH